MDTRPLSAAPRPRARGASALKELGRKQAILGASPYTAVCVSGARAPFTDVLVSLSLAVGVEAEDANISKLMGELEGKNLEELIAEGSKKLASVPSGGGGGAAPAAGGGGGGGAAPAAKEPEPEEEEEDMGFDLFD